VIAADALIDPEVALIVALPTPVPVANPPLAIVATAFADELQLTVLVRVCVLPSLYVPVAANCCVVPFAIVVPVGVTDMDTNSGAVTETLVDPKTVPDVAVILELPNRSPITNPLALTGATAGTEDAHVADAVRSCVLPSLYVPVAASCSVVPSGTAAPPGVIAIETKAAPATVIVVEAEMEFDVAEIVAVPCPELVASPLLPAALLIIATVASEELHVTVVVRSCVLPSV
jgi:hypothetical protein